MAMIDGANVLRLEKPGYPEITIETHVVSNGLTVVLCMVRNPLFSSYVSIPVLYSSLSFNYIGAF